MFLFNIFGVVRNLLNYINIVIFFILLFKNWIIFLLIKILEFVILEYNLLVIFFVVKFFCIYLIMIVLLIFL